MSFKVSKAECLEFSPTFDSHCNRDKPGKENNTSIPVLSLLQFSTSPFVSFGTIKLGSAKSLPLRIENPTEDATTTVIVDKIAASKGFSVDQTSFTIQPEGSIILTVTWTPVEEGGVRELLSFVANGIVKHQAILLGKAEAKKKKKVISLSSSGCFIFLHLRRECFDFSDSLESEKTDQERSFRATAVISPPVEDAHPRLTFCVKPNKVIGVESNHDACRLKALPFSTATVTKLSKVDDALVPDGPKKFPVNSTTVTKGKLEASVESPGLRKKKTSRRRLLEKTLELSEASNAESNTSSPDSALPVISSDSSPDVALESKYSVTSMQITKEKPTSKLSPPEQLLSSISPIRPQVLTMVSSSPSSGLELAAGNVFDKVQPGLYQDQFPVQSRTSVQSKKRKSDEFLRGQSEDKTNVRAKNSSRKPARIVAVAQAKLTFIKQSQTAIPRHPLPFAAKNMFYDDRWIEKQERGFTWWMNYVLTPDDFKVATEVTEVNALSLTMGNDKFNIPKAPTKEEMSFSTYTARQRLNRLRRAACKLFTSDTMIKAIQRLELEVEAKRLLVRKDRHLWKDIGERQKVLNWLISYNPLWLRIGLETIYGELISLESNSDVMGLAMFILGRLLWNPDLAAEFRHPKVLNLYRDGHEEALSRFTLKKLILLVCFLDKAKESRLIEHDPCLFCMDAEFKSSKDLLLAFSRDFLSGEGILSRHLSHLGLAVSHVQTPLDEFNFAVKNLAVDLRCGIRLVRVMELFTLDWTLSRNLRIPAISRLQKVHNVDVALQVLKNKGVDLRDEHGANIDSRDIVDGHREKTLNLLWKIIFAFQVSTRNQLKEEISFLRKTWRTKQKLASVMANSGVAVTRMKSRQAFEHPSQKVTLLMDWVNAVCEFYNLKAENFTVSFSDGRILCYLIHHYHPGHLPAEEIQQRTTQTTECGHRGRVELNNSSTDSDLDFRELLEKERSNFQLVNTAVSYLGGVPAMINPEDMSNTIPNEKVVTCYLSFLCARLLDLRNETRAARVIQGAWRRYKLQKNIELIQQRNLAATKIQALVRKFILRRRMIRQNKAAIMIQTFCRGYVAREKLRVLKKEKQFALQNAAATVIQVYSGLRQYVMQLILYSWRIQSLLKKNHAASVIQAAFRKWHAKKLLERNAAALRIQAWYRMQLCKTQYLDMKSKAVCVQARFRGHLQRCKFRTLKKRHDASIVIQSAFRAYLVRKHVSKMKQNAVAIQRWFQACMLRKAEQKRYFKIKSAVLVLQAAFRGWRVRRSVAQRLQAALLIQTAFRRFMAQRHYLRLKRSAIVLQQRYRAKVLGDKLRQEYMALKLASATIQAIWRGRAERKKISQLHRFARIIQSNYRRYAAQTRFLEMKQAAVVIQRRYRALRDGRRVYAEYTEIKRATIVLQSAYRGKRARQELQKKNKAATLIQSVIRAHSCRQRFLALKHAAIVIQQHHRGLALGRLERSHYVHLRQATITLQAIYRGSKVRQNLRREHQAATIIQAQFRMHKVRVAFLAAKCCAAIIIQQQYRAYRVGKCMQATYLQTKNAAVVIQSAFKGMRVRNNLRKSHQAATVIQAHFRGHSQLKKYQRQQWAASILQQRFRAIMTKNTVMKRYAAIKTAAICIQSAFRGMMVRKQIAEWHKSAKMIQETYRAYKQRRDYLALRNATIRIQQQYRAIVSARQQCKRFCSLRAAAITLQSMYRGMRVRKEIDRKHKAATVIQAMYKMYKTRVPFQAMKLAALVIQRKYRCHLLRKEARENFLKLRCSAIAIQAIYRGNRTRRDIARMNFAATVIQQKYLAYKQRKCFLSIRAAVEFCQRHYRSILAARRDRRDYFAKRRAAVAIQATFRGMQVRRQIRREHEAATIIQSHVRKHILKLRFQRLRRAVCTVQQRFRANKMMKREMAALQEQKSAATILQAAYRGMKSRQTLKQMHQAATTVQATFRAYRACKRYLAMKYAAIVIQQRYRATNVAKQQRKHFLEMCQSALVVQACYRGLKVRRKLLQQCQAAVLIQSCFRRHKEMVKYQAMRLSAIIIQNHYRSYTQARAVRENYLQLRKSAIVIQAAFRGHSLRRQLAEKQEASIIIQATFRMYQQRSTFKRQRWAARVLQQRFRALKLRDEQMCRYQQVRNAAVCLQKSFRGMKGRELARRTKAARTIQSYLRMAVQRQRFLKEKAAAITIQSVYRGHCARVQHARMQASATLIQKWYRSCKLVQKDQNDFVALKQATLTLQSALRGMLVRRLAKRRRAAIKIQSVMRMHVQRKRYMLLRSSILKLQAHYRMFVDRRRYRRLQAATVTLQKHYRAHRATVEQRSSYLKTLQNIKILQARVRGHIEYRRFQRLRASILWVINKWGYLGADNRVQGFCETFQCQCFRAKLQRKRYLKDREDIIKTQRAVRTWLHHRNKAAATIQHAVRKLLLRRRKERLQTGIIKAQALWRGHRSRKHHDTSKVISMRRRLREVNRRVKEEDKLCNKTTTALSYLLGLQNYAYILAALKNLETATRLSPECCERLVESGATHTIFTLIRSCNRSVPSMEIITLSIQVLLNLSKYNRTIDAVYDVDNSVETLLDLLQIYREKAGDKVAEKGGSIFTKACFLLVLLVQDERRAMVGLRKLPKVSDRIRSICRLTLRKCKMDAERNKVKQKMNTSLNGSFLLQATPRKSKPMARFAPDWVLRRDKLKDIVDPLRAIQMLANTLAIVP
uniref:Abnormal spindle microtubule assembly n=1 Tax=Cyprinus carpio TaxID=7962 RepID=A0A8C1KM74_CYPCA